ncbi:MAG: MobF family relaxase [Actinomycetota bacterium]
MSVTPLGARGGGGQGAAAVAKVVDYLEGHRAEPPGRSERWWDESDLLRPSLPTRGPEPAPATEGALAYYADSVEGAGRWVGRGVVSAPPTGPVARCELERMLTGQGPTTGERLVDGRGPAERAEQLGRDHGDRPPNDSPDDLLSLPDAAALLGVSAAYLRRIAARTARLRAEHGQPGEVTFDHPYLDAQREGDGRRWKVRRAEVARFASERKPPNSVIAYDVTFSVPKSVSILWARADPARQGEIVAAVHAAVDAGMAYLQDNAAFVRRGPSSVPRRANGLLAACYTHGTSRALDPQLHCHVVVANMAEGPDGKVRALDGRALFAHAKTASYLAAAELRSQMARRLGVAWDTPERGLADVAGVPRAAVVEMSKRSRELDGVLGQLEAFYTGGRHMRARGLQVAAYLTRAAKDERGVDPDALRPWWAAQLDAVGFDARALSGCWGRQPAPALVTEDDRRRLFHRLGSAQGMTEMSPTFGRREVLQAVADWAGDRLGAAEVCDLADAWLATDAPVALDLDRPAPGRGAEVIRRRDGRRVRALRGEGLYTTHAMLAVEARIFAGYAAGRADGAGLADEAALAAVLAERPMLGEDQREMVRSVCRSGHRVQCVEGPGGTGKTTALEAAAQAWRRSGLRVVGACVQATAAEHLAEATGLECSTVASLLVRLDAYRAGTLAEPPLDERTVLVIDEASTLPNRDLDRLVDHVRAAGAAVRLVGDPAQHSAVAAGGGWRALLERWPDDRAVLWERRRQSSPEMAEVRMASAEYAAGRVAEAMDRLRRDDRLVEASSPDELLDSLVADWYLDRLRRQSDPSVEASSMISDHHYERRELNRRARALLSADGTLHGPALDVGELSFQAGDEVIAVTQSPRLRPRGAPRSEFVRNAERGRVVDVHTGDDADLTVDFERRGRVVVPYSHLATRVRAGVPCPLAHSYAMTSYGAQGATYHAGRHLVTDRSSRPGVYVGLTRGRNDVRLYMVRRDELVPPPERHSRLPVVGDELSTLEAVTARLEAEDYERLARELDPQVPEVARLLRTCSLAELGRLLLSPAPHDPEVVEHAYRDAARMVAARHVVEPPPPVVAHLGRRPDGRLRATWDRAVGAVAVYRARWSVDGWRPGALSPEWALGPRPTSGAEDHYDHIAGVLSAAQAELAAGRPTAELAGQRRELLALLAAAPGSPRRLDSVAEAAHAEDRLLVAQAGHARRIHQVEDLQVGARRRPDQQRLELARRALEASADDLAAAEHAALRARKRADAIASGRGDRGPIDADLAEVQAALDLQVTRALSRPRPYLTALLGPRPDGPAAKDWDEPARAIERFRHESLGIGPEAGPLDAETPLAAAIGPRPDDDRLLAEWRRTARAVEADQPREPDVTINL